jgi:hypothetical protein
MSTCREFWECASWGWPVFDPRNCTELFVTLGRPAEGWGDWNLTVQELGVRSASRGTARSGGAGHSTKVISHFAGPARPWKKFGCEKSLAGEETEPWVGVQNWREGCQKIVFPVHYAVLCSGKFSKCPAGKQLPVAFRRALKVTRTSIMDAGKPGDFREEGGGRRDLVAHRR